MSPKRLVDLIKTVEAVRDAASSRAFALRNDPAASTIAQARADAFSEVLGLLRLELGAVLESYNQEITQ